MRLPKKNLSNQEAREHDQPRHQEGVSLYRQQILMD